MTFLKHNDKKTEYSTSLSQNVTLHTDAKRWGFWNKFFYTFIWLTLPRSIFRLFKVEVNGLENLRKFPEGTPLLLAGNHKSHLDSIIVGTTVANPKFKIRKFVGFMVNGKALNANILTRQLKFFGGFPVYRENPEPALKYAIETLKANLSTVIFPQGGRVTHASVLSDYKHILTEGKSGIGRIILRLNGLVPVVPFYIHGSENVLKIGSFMPKWGSKVSITFGKPIYFKEKFYKNEGWDSKSAEFFDASRNIVDTIMNNIWQLLKDVESSFLELLEKELGLPLDKIDENVPEVKINRIIRKMKNLYKY